MSGEGPAPALSLVVPVYNEEENVGALHAELGRIAGELACPYEIVFVNDGSGLKAYRREVVAGVQLPRGMNRFLPAILGVDPSRVAEVPVRDRPRGGGRSHYGLERVFVVCRDLVALPLLVRRRARTRALARTLGTTGAVLTGVGLAALASALVRPGTHGIALAATLAALLAAAAGRAIGHNVDRFVTAQEEGVFRVRGVV